MREKPLLPWVIAEASGKILAGHCNCMAGLGESCRHVASLLWAVKCSWCLSERLHDTVYTTLYIGQSVYVVSVKSVLVYEWRSQVY